MLLVTELLDSASPEHTCYYTTGDEDADAASDARSQLHQLPAAREPCFCCHESGRRSWVMCNFLISFLLRMQVMKMLMPLLTPAAGQIHFQLPEGAVLVSGDLIARLELDDCNAVTAAQPYPGGFPELGPPLVHSQGVDYRFKEAYSAAKMILEGRALDEALTPARPKSSRQTAHNALDCLIDCSMYYGSIMARGWESSGMIVGTC